PKSFFPPFEKFLSFLFPKFQNRGRNIPVNTRCQGNKVFFIFSNHFSGNSGNSEIISVNKAQTGKLRQIPVTIEIFRQKHYLSSSVRIIFGKLFLFRTV